MSRNPLAGREPLNNWLNKVGYPDKDVIWAITPEVGAIAGDCWTIYDGNFDSLPRDKKLSFKLKDGKNVVHCYIADPRTMLIPPEIAKIKDELEQDRIRLRHREESLIEREEAVRSREVDAMKQFALHQKIGSELDQRVSASVSHIKEWEAHIVQQGKSNVEHLNNLAERDMIIADLQGKEFIAASAVHALDKLTATYMLSKVKKFEDLPADKISDFQQYLVDRADRRFFANISEAGSRLGESFTCLPDEEKESFAKSVILWAVSYNPEIVNEVGREIQAQVRAQQNNQE